MNVLGIVGAGKLGEQIAHYALTDNHYSKVVFIDDFSLEKEINGIKIIGRTDQIEYLFDKKLFDELIIGIGYKFLNKRKEIYTQLKDKIPFGKIMHSTSWIDGTAIIKRGSVIYPNCSIDLNSVVEENTVINNSCSISHDSIIGKHSFLSPSVSIAGFVKIEECCNIGINTTIIDNIQITSNTQTGGGTVVIKNIVESGLYVGNPAKFIR